jgi:hypothetical protein
MTVILVILFCISIGVSLWGENVPSAIGWTVALLWLLIAKGVI